MNPPPDQTPGMMHPSEMSPQQGGRRFWLVVAGIVLFLIVAAGILWLTARDSNKDKQAGGTAQPAAQAGEAPELSTEIVTGGREHVWDIGFLPTAEMIFTERKGTVNVIKEGKSQALITISDVYSRGEGGLMGLAVDPEFASNRYIYTCFNTNKDIRVVRWMVNQAVTGLDNRTDIITGMPRNESGRHSGCRLAFGLDGYLWIGTGDTAQDLTPQPPQDPKSLGGKVLRVDRQGKGAPGNLGGEFDKRIYSYGHRNTQGLAFFAKTVKGVPGISVEHGPGVDDEVNLLKPGNFGWAPPDGSYDETVLMTDKDRFPDAVDAIWASGSPTLAPSGAAILHGSQWKSWEGAIVVAMLKTQHLRIMLLTSDLKIAGEEKYLEEQYGRLRAVIQGPDGSLYVGSSNGTDDQIIRISPQ